MDFPFAGEMNTESESPLEKRNSLMKKACFIYLFVMLISANVYAQKTPLSFRVKAGVAQIPLSEWKSFWTGNLQFRSAAYTTRTPIVFSGLSAHWKWSEKHSLFFGLELMRPKAQLVSSALILNESMDTVGLMPYRIDWKFKTIPLTLGYEYRTGFLKNKFEPVIGLGASLMFTELKAKDILMIDANTVITGPGGKRTGNGYGIEGSLGFHTRISDHWNTIWQARYRYSDGMYFSDDPGDIKIEFSGYDFSVGLEYGL